MGKYKDERGTKMNMKHFTLLALVFFLTSCSTIPSVEIYDVWQENQAVSIEFYELHPYANEYIVMKDGESVQNGTQIYSPLILWFLPEGKVEIKMRRLGVGEWVSVDFEVMK